jgi:uncharacterized protein YkwD
MRCRPRSLLAATLAILPSAALGALPTQALAHRHVSAQGPKRQPHALLREGHRRHAHRLGAEGAGGPRGHRTRLTAAVHPVAPTRPVAAVTRPSAIAATLATPCQNTELVPNATNPELVRAAILCLINRERAQNGEQPLALNAQLGEAAEGHSSEMVADNYFAHVSPSGLTPVDRVRETGYIPNGNVGYVIGENLAWGTLGLSTPQSIVSAWIASPGHLANILETQYTQTGIGVTPQVPASLSGGSAGATYTQEFGVILH